MEYFELPQLKIDNEPNINAIDQLKGNFKSVDLNDDGYQVTYEEGISVDDNKDKWMYYQDIDHDAEFNKSSLVKKMVNDTCNVLNIPKDIIVRKQYTKMEPGWSLNIFL